MIPLYSSPMTFPSLALEQNGYTCFPGELRPRLSPSPGNCPGLG